ncbi:MAG: glycosyltransferase [Pseudomonadota bacterium]
MSLTDEQLSIIIPAYNCAHTLPSCLSAIHRARGDATFELIVVDDGSTDQTAALAKKWSVALLEGTNNRGQGWARNQGASISKGKYLLFIDADVEVEKDCFEHVVTFILSDKSRNLSGMQGIFSWRHPFSSWPSLIYNAIQHFTTRTPAVSYQANPSFLLISKETFHEVGGFREDLPYLEDVEFSMRLTRTGMPLQRGPVQFIHHKSVSWKWLMFCPFTGGRMLRYISKKFSQPSPQHTDATTPAPARRPAFPVKSGRNKFLLNCLAIDVILFTIALASLTIPGSYLRWFLPLSLLPLAIWHIVQTRILWRVNPSPFFVVSGMIVTLLYPVLAITGMMLSPLLEHQKGDVAYWKSLRK